MHMHYFVLLLSVVHWTKAAYVQSATCTGSGLPTWSQNPDYSIYNASLSRSGRHALLSLVLDRYIPGQTCKTLHSNATVDIAISRTRGTSTSQAEIQTQCIQAPPSRDHSWVLLPVTVDLDHTIAFSTFGVQLEVHDPDQGTDSCVAANITVAPTSTTRLLLRWIPIAAFAFILLASTYSIAVPKPTTAASAVNQFDSKTLSNASECLLYLQFAFLSSTLTLRYPGFFQPLVGHLNSFSLFNPGPLAYQHAYSSTVDGLYEINGTYGGTYGFELMHQIVGVPQTMDTWYNMIIAVLIIAALAGISLELSSFWTGTSVGTPTDPEEGLVRRFKRVLRVVLSYFTLPLCALTFYQMNYAAKLPVYHTLFAAVVISLVLLAFIWLFRQLPADRRELSSGMHPDQQYDNTGRHRRFFFAFRFILVLIRGGVIGSLQRFPAISLALLMLCELMLGLATVRLSSDRFWAPRSVSLAFRLVTLALLCGFYPGLAHERVKIGLGYAILALHAFAIVFVFFLPAVFDLVASIWNRMQRTTPNAYGLRELNRRSNLVGGRKSFSNAPEDGNHRCEFASTATSEGHASSTFSGESTPLALDLKMLDHGYFRQNSRRPAYPVYSAVESGPTHYDPTDTSIGSVELHKLPLPVHEHDYSPSIGTIPRTDSHLLEKTLSKPLGPRWSDFTFRESDLVYGAPFRKEAPTPGQEVNESPVAKGSLQKLRESFHRRSWSRTSLFSRNRETQTGFQVLRPIVPPDALSTGHGVASDEQPDFAKPL